MVWVFVLAVDLLLCTSVIDGYTRNMFPSTRNVVLWRSHPLVTLSTNHHQMTILSLKAGHISDSKHSEHAKDTTIPIRTARQVVLEQPAQSSVLVTTSTSGIHIVKSRAAEQSMQMMSTAYGVFRRTLIAAISLFAI